MRRSSPLAALLAAGAMVAGMVPAQATAAESSQKQPPAILQERKRKRRRDASTKRGMSRRERIIQLQQRERAGALSRDSYAELLHLEELERRSRSKLSRRMARRLAYGIGKTVRAIKRGRRLPEPTPLRLGHRVPRAGRTLILQEEGRPNTGRQWRRLRKALARQERAS